MDRKEAIELIKRHMIIHQIGKYRHIKLGEALSLAIKALQEPERKWIPVSERLPEEGYGVLATVNGKHNNTTFIDALEIAEYDSDEGWIMEGYLDWINPDVTAWQPLPEPFNPFKESEEE